MPSLLGSVGFCPSELAAVMYRISLTGFDVQ